MRDAQDKTAEEVERETKRSSTLSDWDDLEVASANNMNKTNFFRKKKSFSRSRVSTRPPDSDDKHRLLRVTYGLEKEKSTDKPVSQKKTPAFLKSSAKVSPASKSPSNVTPSRHAAARLANGDAHAASRQQSRSKPRSINKRSSADTDMYVPINLDGNMVPAPAPANSYARLQT